MVGTRPSTAEVWNWLKEIADPEIPVLSIVDLGIVRDVQWTPDDSELVVTITPTYSGCPAMDAIAREIRSSIEARGIERMRIETKLSPAWTTEWMTEEARERLRDFGVAPPARGLVAVRDIAAAGKSGIRCPRCGSEAIELVSRFGSTQCKALYKCRSCLEPFDAFKRH
jgi:ring-1,2-phenylacetyl-CoA epoxidase subunit PaaD